MASLLEFIQVWVARENAARSLAGEREREAAVLRDTLAAQQTKLQELNTANDELRATTAQKENEIATLRDELRGQKAIARDDVTKLRARFQTFLRSRVQQPLSTARDAANAEPPQLTVISHRLGMVDESIEGEIAWLRSSD